MNIDVWLVPRRVEVGRKIWTENFCHYRIELLHSTPSLGFCLLFNIFMSLGWHEVTWMANIIILLPYIIRSLPLLPSSYNNIKNFTIIFLSIFLNIFRSIYIYIRTFISSNLSINRSICRLSPFSSLFSLSKIIKLSNMSPVYLNPQTTSSPIPFLELKGDHNFQVFGRFHHDDHSHIRHNSEEILSLDYSRHEQKKASSYIRTPSIAQ